MRSFKEYLAEQELESHIHYSNIPNLTSLSGSMSGSGIKGAEDIRVQNSNDSRIKKRIYFYPNTENGLPRPEVGLGHHVYHAKLTNMHDASKPSAEANKIALSAQIRVDKGEDIHNAYESSVLDHGYSGYKTDSLAVVLNKDQPVKYYGSSIDKTFKDHVVDTREKKKSLFDGIPNKDGEHSSSHLTPDQTMFWLKHQKTLKAAVPSIKMQFGKLYINNSHLNNLKKELEKHPDHPL